MIGFISLESHSANIYFYSIYTSVKTIVTGRNIYIDTNVVNSNVEYLKNLLDKITKNSTIKVEYFS